MNPPPRLRDGLCANLLRTDRHIYEWQVRLFASRLPQQHDAMAHSLLCDGRRSTYGKPMGRAGPQRLP